MKKILAAFSGIFIIILIFGCDKEKTITSTEYIHEIEYLQGPTDTVLVIDTLQKIDTLVFHDTVTIGGTDTIIAYDTVYNTIIDTQEITEYIFDTVVKIENFYDTVIVNHIDTVTAYECQPFVHFAFTSLQFYADPIILDFINTEYGYTDGWVYYLSITQSDIQSPSAGVYDIYGYADYWTTDFAGFYPLEYYWRMSYLGGDPSDPENWELSDPPTQTTSKSGGLKIAIERDANIVGN